MTPDQANEAIAALLRLKHLLINTVASSHMPQRFTLTPRQIRNDLATVERFVRDMRESAARRD